MERTGVLALMGTLALAGCGDRETGGSGPSAPGSGEPIVISGQLTYRARIALPPDSRAVVDLRRSSPDDAVVAETSIDLEGKQVPVLFELPVDLGTLDATQTYTLHGTIYSHGLPLWSSSAVALDAPSTSVGVGMLELQRFAGDVTATTWQCGERTAAIDFAGDSARLRVGDETFALRQVRAASGAKYEAVGDASTFVWNKGDSTTVAVRGEEFPPCTAAGAQAGVFRARGNEPGWLLEIGAREMKLVTKYGESTTVVETPEPVEEGGSLRYVAETAQGPITATISDGPCADAMSGMPYPKTVIVAFAGETLSGCGGEPRELLVGDEWAVDEIGGEPLVQGSRATIAFTPEGRVAGSASCNSYTSAYTLTGEALSFSKAAVTMKACAPELMAQEDTFLEILAQVNRFEIAADGGLVLHAADGRRIKVHRG